MSKSKHRYKVYNGKAVKEILENSRVFILIGLFAIGIIIGSTAIKNNGETAEKIRYIIGNYAMQRAGQGMSENFFNSLLSNMMFVLVSVFLGFSLIGSPLIMTLPFFKGAAIGAVSGYLYLEYKLMGLGYSVLMIYPSSVICMVALIIIFNESCEYSHNAYLKAINGRGHFEKDETKLFLIRQFIFSLIVAVSALIDAVCVELFSGFFVF
ncbi:MAG: stage II sporulation protein M [Clostridia bacterium]|nr:stage II sporulation protein M [Clostridia bacterium]